MKTQAMRLITAGLLLQTLSMNVFAGDKGGNGGGVQYCPEVTGAMYEVYDLKEIKDHISTSRRRVVRSYDGRSSKEEYFAAAVNKVRVHSPRLAEAIVRANEFYQLNVKDNGNFKLEIVKDADLYSINKGCDYKQLVNWIEPEQMDEAFGIPELHILRNDSIYDALDPLHQAASDFHESAYRVRRAFGLDNKSGSNFVRLITGQVFSDGEIDKDLITQIALYDKKQINGFEVLFTSKKCSEVPVWKITNNGDRVVTQSYIGMDGGWHRDFKLSSGKTATSKKDTLSLKLDQGGVFGNFRRSVNIPLLIEVTACGEKFVVNKTFRADQETIDINMKVISSPL
jgi:hypothetical protein